MMTWLLTRERAQVVLGRRRSNRDDRPANRHFSWPLLAALAVFLAVGAAPALAVLIYGLLAAGLWRSRCDRKLSADRRSESIEMLAGIVAGLRVGARPEPFALTDRELDHLAHCAQRVATRTGAQLADALERVELHARAEQQASRSAEAAGAGSHLTAGLLFALPLGGVGLGYLIGADPLRVLAQTELGTACLLLGACLQVLGVVWMRRLTDTRRTPRPAFPRARHRLGRLLPALSQPQSDPAPGRSPRRLARLHTRSASADDFPIAADLLATALRVGLPQQQALSAVATALDGPTAERLHWTARELAMGVTPAHAWRHLTALAPRLAPAVARSADNGSALSGALLRCAEDMRADGVNLRQRRAQQAAVLLAIPLGLCFLPAFVLIGLTPTVIAVLTQTLPAA